MEDKKFITKKMRYRKTNNGKNYRHIQYSALLIAGELENHLHNVDVEAGKILDQFIKSANKNVPDKTTQQMEWIGYMNNVKKYAEEIIYKEIIYI